MNKYKNYKIKNLTQKEYLKPQNRRKNLITIKTYNKSFNNITKYYKIRIKIIIILMRVINMKIVLKWIRQNKKIQVMNKFLQKTIRVLIKMY